MFRYTILLVCLIVPAVISKSIAPVTCGPVCEIYCEYGNVLDANGCPTCKCKSSPCRNGQTPLPNYFCGRGPTHQDCPSGYNCIIAPNDAYAVCCPRCKKAVTKPPTPTEKPGSCPKPSSDMAGICIAKCSTDDDCEGDEKCCGSCPRTCVSPV